MYPPGLTMGRCGKRPTVVACNIRFSPPEMPMPKTFAFPLAKQVASNLKIMAKSPHKAGPAADYHGMVNNPPLMPLPQFDFPVL